MLTGKELGKAIDSAIKKKGVAKSRVAAHFGVKPPSIQDWINRGTIGKEKLPELWRYFADVVGPAHWGMTAQESGEPSPDAINLRALPLPRVSTRAAVEQIARQLAQLPPKHRRAIGAFLDQLAETPDNSLLIEQIVSAMSPTITQTAPEPAAAPSSST